MPVDEIVMRIRHDQRGNATLALQDRRNRQSANDELRQQTASSLERLSADISELENTIRALEITQHTVRGAVDQDLQTARHIHKDMIARKEGTEQRLRATLEEHERILEEIHVLEEFLGKPE